LGLGQTMFRLRITKHLMFSSVYPQGSSKLASLSLRLSLPTQVREEGEDKGREHQHFPWPISCRVSSRRFDTTQHPYALVQKQWEKIKRKGRCECHASGDGEGQGQNYGYVCHGNLPSSAMWRLPEQGKDFRDCHHVLELSCLPLARLLRQANLPLGEAQPWHFSSRADLQYAGLGGASLTPQIAAPSPSRFSVTSVTAMAAT
jgi:hypothetical protein